jgi:hypothetical protein
MNSRRGNIFFSFAQLLLLPGWLCFAVTLALRLGGANPILLKTGLYSGLAQVPCTALAILLTLTAGMGELLSRKRLQFLSLEIVIAVAAITLVFLWRGVYSR